MIKQMKRFKNKREKGQVLVILAITITMLVAFIGLAVDMGYMYVSYARLRRAADSAALAATGEFKKNTPINVATNMTNAAVQFLNLNGITQTTVTVENCYYKFNGTTLTAYPDTVNGSGDPELCTTPARKLVRVTVTEDVPTFFLAVIGWRKIPITVSSISEAASLDIVLVLDKSESMAQYTAAYVLKPPAGRDPEPCNTPPASCHPFEEVKTAAINFLTGYLYTPYDRAAIVSFAQMANIEPIAGVSGLSEDTAAITTTINNMTVYMGGDDINHSVPNTCHSDYFGTPLGFGYDSAHFDLAEYATYYPCRLFSWSNDTTDPWPGPLEPGATKGPFEGFDCPRASAAPYQIPAKPEDYSMCQTSNIGAGLRTAASIFSGTVPGAPAPRPEALWVTIVLTDGVANASTDYNFAPTHPNGIPYCGGTSTNGTEKSNAPICRDTNALIRHCLFAFSVNYPCADEDDAVKYPGLAAAGSDFHVDALNYDADDYARDQADVLHDGTLSLIFVIGIGSSNPLVYNEITAILGKDGHTNLADGPTASQCGCVATQTPPSGATLLNYIAAKGGTDKYYPSDIAGLQKVFLAIANRISTRLTH